MKAPIRWGILSTGRIAHTFAKALATSSTGTLVAVGSRSLEPAEAFAKEFGVAAAYGSYEALLADPDVQAVYIATPHPKHAEWCIKAAEAGKHILCEKPATLNAAQLTAVLDAVEQNGVFFMEAFMYRCHPQTAKVVDLVKSGVIGKLQHMQISFGFRTGMNPESRLLKNELGGGGILDVGCYAVSLARLLAGAAAGKPFEDPKDVKGVAHIGETGVDEWAAAVLAFPGGITAEVATGVRQNMPNTATLLGEDGRIVVESPWFCKGAVKVIKGDQVESHDFAAPENLYTFEIDAVAAYHAQGEAPSPAMGKLDSLGNMQALDAWRASIGLVYEPEKQGSETQARTVSGRPLTVLPDAPMPYGEIPGLGKKTSRLIMGADNQRSLPQFSMIFDLYYGLGGNAVDTAWLYGGGLQERLLGQWLEIRGLREDFTVIAKGGHTPFCEPISLQRQFAESLDRLRTNYADIYMMHRDNEAVPVGEFVDLLSEWQAKGRVRAYGFSNWGLDRIKAALAYAREKGVAAPTVISNNFSLAHMVTPVWGGCLSAADQDFREFLKTSGMVLLPWSSQARGFFTDRAGRDKLSDAELVRSWYSDDNFERKARAEQLAAKYGVEPINIALAYVLCQPFPVFSLIGPRTPGELRSSLKSLPLQLTPEELAWLDLQA
jgi:predicted dehydrogenase/aryl-alcohol dehydrogenase-like predicted oxidoreductase